MGTVRVSRYENFLQLEEEGCIRVYLNSEHTGLKYARKKKDSHTFEADEGLHSGVSRVPHLAHRLDRVIPILALFNMRRIRVTYPAFSFPNFWT